MKVRSILPVGSFNSTLPRCAHFYIVSKQLLKEITLQSMCLCRNLFLSTSVGRIASILELAMWFSLMPMRKRTFVVLTIPLEGIQIQIPTYAWFEYSSNSEVAKILQQYLRNSNFRTCYIKRRWQVCVNQFARGIH